MLGNSINRDIYFIRKSIMVYYIYFLQIDLDKVSYLLLVLMLMSVMLVNILVLRLWRLNNNFGSHNVNWNIISTKSYLTYFKKELFFWRAEWKLYIVSSLEYCKFLNLNDLLTLLYSILRFSFNFDRHNETVSHSKLTKVKKNAM